MHIEAIEQIKGKDAAAQWAFKAIFQKALIRLGRLVAFESKGEDPNLGSIDDLLDVMTALFDAILTSAPLPEREIGIWTFIATNPGGSKIKVAKDPPRNGSSLCSRSGTTATARRGTAGKPREGVHGPGPAAGIREEGLAVRSGLGATSTSAASSRPSTVRDCLGRMCRRSRREPEGRR